MKRLINKQKSKHELYDLLHCIINFISLVRSCIIYIYMCIIYLEHIPNIEEGGGGGVEILHGNKQRNSALIFVLIHVTHLRIDESCMEASLGSVHPGLIKSYLSKVRRAKIRV